MSGSKHPSLSTLTPLEWADLIARIQSHSTELESALARASGNLIEALSGLSSLEELTHSHLVPLAPLPPAPGTMPTPPATPLNAAAAMPGPARDELRYQTTRQEYAPALNQEDLVQALLQYQKRQGLRRNSGRVLSKSAASPSREPENHFTPVRAPQVKAEPKTVPLGSRASAPSIRIPVLRAKPEDRHGDE